MKIIYAQQPIPDYIPKSIFLVGPTPRDESVQSWRPEALEWLDKLKYDGIVFVPEPEGGKWLGNYNGQIDWEWKALDACLPSLQNEGCSAIAAWVPRDLETLPAFTTNVEFGHYVSSGVMFYGRPENAPKTSYLDRLYHKVTERKPCHSLEELMKLVVKWTS